MTEGVFFPDRAIRQAAKTFGTPFYVYDEAGLRRNTAALQTAFSWSAGFSAFFPVRWNRNRMLLRVLLESGCGAECTSASELRDAADCGFSGELLRYAPQRPEPEGEQLAKELDAAFVLDDPVLRPGVVPRCVILRVHPEERLFWRGKSVAQSEKSKFGMEKREAFWLAEYYLSQGAEVGLGMWLSENSTEVGLWPSEAQTMLMWMGEFWEKTGMRMTCCDLGAGPGIDRRGGDREADIAEIGKLVRDCAGAVPVRFSGVPGFWLAGRQGLLISLVMTVKKRERPLIVLDMDGAAALRHLPRGARQELRAVGKRMDQPRSLQLTDVTGCGPELRGQIAERCVLPPLKEGDLVALLCQGVHLPRPGIPELIWGADGTLHSSETDPVRAW